MRTDSNTVLSLSSGVLPKTSKSSLTSQESGAAFEGDFNKAKAVINPENTGLPAGSVETVEAPTNAADMSSTVTSLKESASLEKTDNKLAVDDTSEGELEAVSAAIALAAVNGKVLQLDGDMPPVKSENSSASASTATPASTLAPTSTLTPIEVSGEKIPPELSLLSSESLDLDSERQKTESRVDLSEGELQTNLLASPSMPVTFSDVSSNDSEFQLVENEDLLKENNSPIEKVLTELPSTVDDSLFNSVGVLGGDKVFSGRFLDKVDSKSGTKPLSDDSSESVDRHVELALLESNGNIDTSLSNDDGQLSWVLSQMEKSAKAEALPVNSTMSNAQNVTDAAKVGVASVLASNSAALSLGENIASTIDGGDSDSVDNILMDEGLLANEPIELRKKEQEAMIGRMSAQVDGRALENNESGGLNSSLHNNGAARASAIVGTAAVNTPQTNLTMNVPPQHPGWANEMTQKVAWVAREGGHTAHIRLDPPELGSLTVKISVDNDSNTQVSFIAATPQARDLLEGQMNRLRDMLAQQGMDLSRADVDVSQQDTSGMQRDTDQKGRSNQMNVASQDEGDEDLISGNMSYVSATGVDYYA
jgi:flagellar hook-length control protein FliK